MVRFTSTIFLITNGFVVSQAFAAAIDLQALHSRGLVQNEVAEYARGLWIYSQMPEDGTNVFTREFNDLETRNFKTFIRGAFHAIKTLFHRENEMEEPDSRDLRSLHNSRRSKNSQTRFSEDFLTEDQNSKAGEDLIEELNDLD